MTAFLSSAVISVRVCSVPSLQGVPLIKTVDTKTGRKSPINQTQTDLCSKSKTIPLPPLVLHPIYSFISSFCPPSLAASEQSEELWRPHIMLHTHTNMNTHPRTVKRRAIWLCWDLTLGSSCHWRETKMKVIWISLPQRTVTMEFWMLTQHLKHQWHVCECLCPLDIQLIQPAK